MRKKIEGLGAHGLMVTEIQPFERFLFLKFFDDFGT